MTTRHVNISKQTEQYRKNYFTRAFKAASSRSHSAVYAVKTSDGYLLSDSFLLLRVKPEMAYKLDWLRGVKKSSVKLKSDAPESNAPFNLDAQLTEWNDKAQLPVSLTNTLYDLSSSLMVRVFVGDSGEKFYVDADKLRLLGECYDELKEFTFYVYENWLERSWKPGQPERHLTLLARDQNGVPHLAVIPLESNNNFETIEEQQSTTPKESVA